MQTVARRGAAPVLLALLFGTGAFIYGSVRTATYEATAKASFIEDTRFDYLDAERDRLVGFVESDGARAVREIEGVSEIRYDRPSRETFIDVIARGSDPNAVAEVANRLAGVLVDRDRLSRSERITKQIDAHAALVIELSTEFDALTLSMTEAGDREAFAEANRFGSDADTLERLTIDLRDAQADLFLDRRRRNAVGSLRDDTEEQISMLETELAGLSSAISVVQPAGVPDDTASLSATLLAATVAAAAFAIATVMLFLQAPYLQSLTRPDGPFLDVGEPHSQDSHDEGEKRVDPWAA